MRRHKPPLGTMVDAARLVAQSWQANGYSIELQQKLDALVQAVDYHDSLANALGIGPNPEPGPGLLDSPMTDDKPDNIRDQLQRAVSAVQADNSRDQMPNDDQGAAEGVWALEACPYCGESLVGPEIPENRRHMWGQSTHYSKLIAIYDRDLDRTTHFECPKCRGRIERDGSKGPAPETTPPAPEG